MTAYLVADLGLGDSGKGKLVAFLSHTQPVDLIVRYNGGAQASHHVVTPSGIKHAFHQFGSGSFTPGIRTFLSRYMMVDPLNLLAESRDLTFKGMPTPLAHLFVDGRALVTTPLHAELNRIKERARTARHGSTGMGIGETRAYHKAYGDDALFMADLRSYDRTRTKLSKMAERMVLDARQASDTPLSIEPDKLDRLAVLYATIPAAVRIVGDGYLTDLLRRSNNSVFEGAHGVLLDEKYGFAPHTTWTNTRFDNALELLDETGFDQPVVRLGVTRTYATRHGAGPLPTEKEDWLNALPEDDNGYGEFTGDFRVGRLDMVMLRYSLNVLGGIDGLVVTHSDRIQALPDTGVAVAYWIHGHRYTVLPKDDQSSYAERQAATEQLKFALPEYALFPKGTRDYLAEMERLLKVPLLYESNGPSTLEMVTHTPRSVRHTHAQPQTVGALS